jgi:4-amino-4-deoxy-L-arabinose transferase-like glycosyltransferase
MAAIYATRLGPWAFSDGAGYVMLARNVVAGRGLGLMRASGDFQPLSMHPPLYPLSLVALRLTGVELLTAVRWLDAVLFALTIAIVGLMIFYVSRMTWLALGAAVVTLVTPAMTEIYTGALSEPLFFVAGLGSALLLVVFFDTRRRWMLVVAGLAAGMAVLTRYLGVAYVGTGIVGLLIFGVREWKRRVVDTAIYAILATIPTVIWLAWANSQSGANAPRQWIWDLSGLWDRAEPIRGGLVAEFWKWIPFVSGIEAVAYRYRLGLLAIIALAFVLTLIFTIRRLWRTEGGAVRRDPALRLVGLMVLFIGGYLMILSIVFLFGRPPLDAADIDQRILTPVYLALLLSVFALVPLVLRAWPGSRWGLGVPIVLTLLAIVWFAPQSWRSLEHLRAASGGYMSQSWLNSETVQSARTLPGGISIISNESTALMFHLDRPAYDVPELIRAEPQSEFLRFGDGEAGEERIFREDGAAFILFDSVYWQLRGVYDEQADTRLASMVEGLDLYADLNDGAIYFYPQP